MTSKTSKGGSGKPDRGSGSRFAQILDFRRENANASVAEMARALGMSPETARRREAELVKSGVLRYVAEIDHDKVSTFGIEALIEVSFPGNANVDDCLLGIVETVNRKELREAMTLIGDVDALIRIRAETIPALRDLVMQIRGCPNVTGTRTRIIAGRPFHHATIQGKAAESRSKRAR